MPTINQKGIISQLMMMSILGLGMVAAVYLTQTGSLNLFSKASNSAIVFKAIQNEALPKNPTGTPISDSYSVKIEITSPFVLSEVVTSPGSSLGKSEKISENRMRLSPETTTLSTKFYKIAENPYLLDSAESLPYTSEPTIIDYTFKPNPNEGRFIWVEFISPDGKTERKTAQIIIKPAISSPTPTPGLIPDPSPSAIPTPLPSSSPITDVKKFSCNFNTFEPITDGKSFVGDPNLVKLDEFNTWVMIYGKGSVSGGTVNQYSAHLQTGDSLGANKNNWTFNSTPIVPLTSKTWDSTNIETGNYVKGWTSKKLSDGLPGWEERVYYAGRNTASTPVEVGYPIGVLYKDSKGVWKKYSRAVYYPSKWWETGYGIGEPAMYYEPGADAGGAKGTWHLYYQACTNKGLANGYPMNDECFIVHRKSPNGVNNWELVPSSTTGKPWIVGAGLENFFDKIAFTGKPEIKVDSSGLVHWVTMGGEKIAYANPADLNGGLVHKEVLFTINDCKADPSRQWCNWKFDAGHTFGFDPAGNMWVYFTVSQCAGVESLSPSESSCPTGNSAVSWRIARVQCNKI